MKPTIRICLFGKFSVHFGDELILAHSPHKAQELLAYLALHTGKVHPRDSLADLLWAGLDTPNSRKYLRQALWQVHSGLLAVGRARLARLLQAESDWLALEFGEREETDVANFEQAFASANATPGDALGPGVARQLADAVRLYRGDLLQSWVVEWCGYDRERFRGACLNILEKLAEYHEFRHEYETANVYATLALRMDPARERSHRSLMRSLAKSGDRCGAMRQYLHCVEALRDELGVGPEPETVVLEQMIRAGDVVGGVRQPVRAANAAQRGGPRGITVVASARRFRRDSSRQV